jgi:pyruvate dehydrogenase E1 component beta subunit
MAIDILMPALSPTMEQGKLAKWLKKEGDQVKPGDVLAEIETDKATMEVEAIDEGVLAKILVSDGTDNVAVNTPIAILAGEGEDVSTAASSAKAPAAPKPEAQPAPTPDMEREGLADRPSPDSIPGTDATPVAEPGSPYVIQTHPNWIGVSGTRCLSGVVGRYVQAVPVWRQLQNQVLTEASGTSHHRGQSSRR